jgi:MinD superfamily P-loop ATPase
MSSQMFTGGNQAVIDPRRCTECGTCIDLCKFDAIDAAFTVDAISCEGCGVCVDLCPEKAIDFPQQKSGDWYISNTRVGPMVHARLGIAEENSGKLVSLVRREARKLAEENGQKILITDGPPGIGCPVIASLTGAEKVIIVVEPTISGLHDVRRVASLARHFGIETMLCVNRFDINIDVTEEIEAYAAEHAIYVLPRVPFDPDFIHAMVDGKTLPEYNDASPATEKIKQAWQAITSHNQDQSIRNVSLNNYIR